MRNTARGNRARASAVALRAALLLAAIATAWTGAAGQDAEAAIHEVGRVPLRHSGSGCWIGVDEAARYPVPITDDWCASLYLANRYANRRSDVVHLLDYLGLDSSVSRSVLLDPATKITVGFNPPRGSPVAAVREKLTSTQCEHLRFFDVDILCFNRVQGALRKCDNLPWVIPALTVMVYTSDSTHWNPLLQVRTTAHQLMTEYDGHLFDGSSPDLLVDSYDSTLFQSEPSFRPCGKEGVGGQGHKFPDGTNAAFLCKSNLSLRGRQNVRGRWEPVPAAETVAAEKLRLAGVIYHEMNHPLGREISSNWEVWCHKGHLGQGECTFRRGSSRYTIDNSDWDMKSVRGAHISYLFYLSQHGLVDCESRKKAFITARELMECKVCPVRCPPAEDCHDPSSPPPLTAPPCDDTPISHPQQTLWPACQGEPAVMPRADPCPWENGGKPSDEDRLRRRRGCFPPDMDQDGFRPPDDCDDGDPSIHPVALELPGNFVDEDCDGSLGACDPCVSWLNHGEYVQCVARELEALVSAGLLTPDERDALVTSAARSDVGKSGFVAPECP